MKSKTEAKGTVQLVQKRMEILSGAKLKETDKMDAAIKIQDAIRSKTGIWQGSKEIKRWRATRS